MNPADVKKHVVFQYVGSRAVFQTDLFRQMHAQEILIGTAQGLPPVYCAKREASAKAYAQTLKEK